MRVIFYFGLAASLGLPASAYSQPMLANDFIVIVNSTVREYNLSGTLIRSVPVPNPTPGPRTAEVRGVSVLNPSQYVCFDGTFSPRLNFVNIVAGTNQSFTTPGWSTTNTGLGGGLSARGNLAFVTDMFTGGGAPNGLIRFDTTTGQFTRFGPAVDFIDVAYGMDGIVYGLAGSVSGTADLFAFDPATLAQLRHFTLNGLAPDGALCVQVAANGDIFTGSGFSNISGSGSTVARHSTSGSLLGTLTVTGGGMADIDIDAAGHLIAVAGGGDFFLSDTSLSSVIQLGNTGSLTAVQHLSFVVVPEPSAIVLSSGAALIAVFARKRTAFLKHFNPLRPPS